MMRQKYCELVLFFFFFSASLFLFISLQTGRQIILRMIYKIQQENLIQLVNYNLLTIATVMEEIYQVTSYLMHTAQYGTYTREIINPSLEFFCIVFF